MSNPDLQIVEAKGADKRSRYEFTLRVNLKRPKLGGEGEDGAVDPAADATATATATGGAAP
jgi:type IV pilus assembly protein PilN